MNISPATFLKALGPAFLSPLRGEMHRRIVLNARALPQLAATLASYHTSWQMALDLNQTAEEREEHEIAAISLGSELGAYLVKCGVIL